MRGGARLALSAPCGRCHAPARLAARAVGQRAVLGRAARRADRSCRRCQHCQGGAQARREADWSQCPVPRATMRRLLERRDAPAIADTLVWFALILGSGYAGYALWGTWWAVIPFGIYAVLYASTSDSRWHEAGHGTAFRTDWMNSAL